MPRDKVDDGEAFVSEVCWHYYVNGLNQVELAKVLGVPRLRVNQAIQKARSQGMVKVHIESPFLARIELQDRLKRTLNLDRVLIAPANRDDYSYHTPVGEALAYYLVKQCGSVPWKSIGVSWGLTLESAIRRLPKLSWPDLDIVSMNGGTTRGASFNSFSVASGFAERFGANYSLLVSPIYAPANLSPDSLLASDIFDEHLKKFDMLDAAILVAGDVSDRSFLVGHGLPKDVVLEELVACGAVGDILGRFLDSDGNEIKHPLNSRTIGIELDALEAIPEKILAAAGSHKVDIILAAIKRNFVNTLITDDVTAELILERE